MKPGGGTHLQLQHSGGGGRKIESSRSGAGGMAQQLTALADLPEDLGFNSQNPCEGS